MTTTSQPTTGTRNQFDTCLETELVHTTYFTGGYSTAMAVVLGNHICVLHGPSGTGKTTCALHVANALERPGVVVTMSRTTSPLDLLRRFYFALTGVMHNGTRIAMENDLKVRLVEWGGVAVFDEMQNVGVGAMQDLVWLYEETRHAFAVVIVGSESLAAVRAHPQLLTRVMGHERFEPLAGKTLVDAVRAMDATFAVTPASVLGAHDQRCCHGLLREWVQTLRWVRRFRFEGPLTSEQLRMIAEKIPDQGPRPEPGEILRPGPRRRSS